MTSVLQHSAIHVVSPLSGRVIAAADIPDPVFANGLVGYGVAVVPDSDADMLTAVAPMTGRVVKVMPHAYIVQHVSGPAVLVHVGIDTVHLKGEGFIVHVQKGDQVEAGDRMISVDVALIRAKNLSPCCPVVALDTKPGAVLIDSIGSRVEAGELLFELVES
ncbi:PTS glucose transporter subunit IIA [Cryobacterium sp. Y82]|uniref:PTS sugar transporter subunit IIA n=1 Tax=Cryobacterium sp. Y82 TaxID=2045017 RepID=UPI000CE306D8|nr:PTS glucose transporter subunit IIA [Cryobacterium sp. Y82]